MGGAAGYLALALLAAVLSVLLMKQSPAVGAGLQIAACVLILLGAAGYVSQIVAFIRRLSEMLNVDDSLLAPLFKAVGIGFLGEIVALICTDCENTALSKSVQMFTTGVILSLSLPLMEALIALVKKLAGEAL